MTEPPSRLMAHFVLRSSGENVCLGHMPIPAGDYITEAKVVGKDIEILMYEKDEDVRA